MFVSSKYRPVLQKNKADSLKLFPLNISVIWKCLYINPMTDLLG